MKNKKLLCSVCFLFAFMSALWGQNITVKGNVTSKTDGQPIIGASVVEATATANGTITDLDGNFTLSVPANSTLKITYIGYNPVTVKAAAIVNVLLEEDTQMVDEVVVTGYGNFTKSSFTSVSLFKSSTYGAFAARIPALTAPQKPKFSDSSIRCTHG